MDDFGGPKQTCPTWTHQFYASIDAKCSASKTCVTKQRVFPASAQSIDHTCHRDSWHKSDPPIQQCMCLQIPWSPSKYRSPRRRCVLVHRIVLQLSVSIKKMTRAANHVVSRRSTGPNAFASFSTETADRYRVLPHDTTQNTSLTQADLTFVWQSSFRHRQHSFRHKSTHPTGPKMGSRGVSSVLVFARTTSRFSPKKKENDPPSPFFNVRQIDVHCSLCETRSNIIRRR